MGSFADEFGHKFRGLKVVVTGATGFIGTNLCRALASLGACVTGVSLSGKGRGMHEGISYNALDLRRLDDVKAFLGRHRPSLIVHLAGRTLARREREMVLPTFEANAIGTVHLLLAAAEVSCDRFLLIGSSEAEGADRDNGVSSPYAASKHVAEIYGRMFHRLYGLPVIHLRTFLTFGPWQEPPKLIPYVIEQFLRGEAPVLTSGGRRCDVVYVEDVVRGLLKAAVAPAAALGSCIDLGSGMGVTIRELVMQVASVIGPVADPVFGGLPDRPYEHEAVADLEPAASLLGWRPQWPLEEALRSTVAWHRQRLGLSDPLQRSSSLNSQSQHIQAKEL
ncbi:MAG: NAD-dependent epimerase/dehydratase family protein [Nitrospirae bacterium]|nr:MAG: NAD-dependent epimerase/dehydratase family protein [Nitrospirota bacterium]